MSATIKIAVDDKQAEEALKQLASRIKETGHASELTSNQLEAVSRELDAKKAQRFNEEVKQLANELDKSTDGAKRFAAEARSNAIFESSFDGAANSVKKVSAVLPEATRRTAALNKELESRAASRYAADTKKLADAFEGVSASKAKAAQFDGGLKDSFGGLGKGLLYLYAMKETVAKVGQGIHSLAEDGSRSMKELEDSFVAVKKAAVAFTNDAQVSAFFSGIAKSINSEVVPALAKLPQSWRAAQDTASRTITLTGEWLRLIPEGATLAIREMRIMQDEANKIATRQKELQDGYRELNKIVENENAKRAAARETDTLRAIDDEAKLSGMAFKEIERIRVMTEEGRASAEELAAARIEAAKKTEKIYDRIREVQKEKQQKLEDATKEFNDKQKEEAQAVADKEIALAKAIKDAEIQDIKDRQQAYRDAMVERWRIADLDAAKKAEAIKQELEMQKAAKAEELQKFQAFLQAKQQLQMGGGAGGFNQQGQGQPGGPGMGAGGMGAGMVKPNPQQLLAVQKAREKQAELDFIKAQKQVQAGGWKPQDFEQKGGKYTGKALTNDAQKKAQLQRGMERARREARKQFQRDRAKGNITNVEAAGAQGKLLKANSDLMINTGKATGKQAELLEGLTNQAIQSANGQAQLEDKYNNLVQALQQGVPPKVNINNQGKAKKSGGNTF